MVGGGGGMESSVTGMEGSCGVADFKVGTIVWVRRRNGSWWPGRILGPEELAASSLISPRSGTPVKLLGREDASVDWYNLEKSKRVKPFRCGEFDACIEKAETSQPVPTKKREKYARREDAILHALELERQQLESKLKAGFKLDSLSCKYPIGTKTRVNNFSSEAYVKSIKAEPHGKYTGSKPQLPSQKSSRSQGNNITTDPLHGYKSRSCQVQEDDTSEALCRISERQFPANPSLKRKPSSTGYLECSQGPGENNMDGFCHGGHVQGRIEYKGAIIASNKKSSMDTTKDDSFNKKADGQRPFPHVLQNNLTSPLSLWMNSDSTAACVEEQQPVPSFHRAKRSQHIYLPIDSSDAPSSSNLTLTMPYAVNDVATTYLNPVAFSDEQASSDLIGGSKFDSAGRESSETETEDETEFLQNMTSAPGTLGIVAPELVAEEPYLLQLRENVKETGKDGNTLVNFAAQANTPSEDNADSSSEFGVTKWNMKGRRNIRSSMKRTINMSSRCNWLVKCDGISTPRHVSGQGIYQTEFDSDGDETDSFDNMGQPDMNMYCGTSYGSVPKSSGNSGRPCSTFNDSGNDSHKISHAINPRDRLYLASQEGDLESSRYYPQIYPSHHEAFSRLVDVDLKVQASYQGERVPLVSLMSRLNGKAIIGHPVQVEILEDGYTNQLLSTIGLGSGHSDASQLVWRSGCRRTATQRVPRSNPAYTSLDCIDEDAAAFYSDWKMKIPVRKLPGLSSHHPKFAKKSAADVPHSQQPKHQPTILKKGNQPGQKVRKLSSFATTQRQHGRAGDAKHSVNTVLFGGLIKQEGTVPLVTCVPAKVVFSRILEAVGRPQLGTAHRVRTTSPVVRDPP